jgi:hypothetical protein
MWGPCPTRGLLRHGKKNSNYTYIKPKIEAPKVTGFNQKYVLRLAAYYIVYWKF